MFFCSGPSTLIVYPFSGHRADTCLLFATVEVTWAELVEVVEHEGHVDLVSLANESLGHYAIHDTKVPARDDCKVSLDMVTDLVHDDIFLLVFASALTKKLKDIGPRLEESDRRMEELTVKELNWASELDLLRLNVVKKREAPQIHEQHSFRLGVITKKVCRLRHCRASERVPCEHELIDCKLSLGATCAHQLDNRVKAGFLKQINDG